MRTACPCWLLQIGQNGPEISQVFLYKGHELVHTASSVRITDEQKGNATCCILLLQNWFTSAHIWKCLHLLGMSERKTRKKTPHFIVLPYSVSSSLHCFIAVLPFVEFLFPDNITIDKDCYEQQKPLYLIMWRSISFVANL